MPQPIHVLVTGSTRGIGAAISTALTARGARVIGHGRNDADGIVGADLADPAAADQLWNTALARLDGRIEVLINNAGVADELSIDAPLADWQAEWGRTLQINLQAAADLCRRAVQHFQARGAGGRIVNVASRASYRGDSPTMWHYAASKAGMVGMTKSIARGYANQGILAFSLCPGWVATDMATDVLAGPDGARQLAEIPLGRAADAAEIASVAAFLALEAPPSMTGASIDVNGASFVR
jgi:NAD(P)-dependent dehydrogenase (short-subunit alcohol dehydrogenase family)